MYDSTWYTYINTYIHYITLHHTTLHYITLHYTTLHYITLHYTTLHYITLHYTTLHYITLHYTTLHYITLHYITLHYIHTYIHTQNHTEVHIILCICITYQIIHELYSHIHSGYTFWHLRTLNDRIEVSRVGDQLIGHTDHRIVVPWWCHDLPWLAGGHLSIDFYEYIYNNILYIWFCVYYIYTHCNYIHTLMVYPSKEKSTALRCIPHILSYIVLFEPRDMFESHFWTLVWRTRSAKRLNDICFWDFFIVARVATQFDTCSIYIRHTFWWTIQRSRSAAESLNILEGRALRQPLVLLVKWWIACVWKIEGFFNLSWSVVSECLWGFMQCRPHCLTVLRCRWCMVDSSWEINGHHHFNGYKTRFNLQVIRSSVLEGQSYARVTSLWCWSKCDMEVEWRWMK